MGNFLRFHLKEYACIGIQPQAINDCVRYGGGYCRRRWLASEELQELLTAPQLDIACCTNWPIPPANRLYFLWLIFFSVYRMGYGARKAVDLSWCRSQTMGGEG